MHIPAAEFIESAADDLKKVDTKILLDQKSELCEALGDRIDQMTCIDGYQLGLQVARTMIATNIELQLKGVKLEDVL